jgi:methanogenic corrinoid protein MtbC1
MQLDNYALNKIMKACIGKLGLVDAVTHIFFPFLHKIGEMWQLGALNPAHEHFATNLIRQKITGATDELSDKIRTDGKRFMLFLPQDETHDVGLLLAQYLIKKQGHHILYLGQNMPFSDLYNTASYYKPHYAVTAVTLAHNKEAEKLVKKLLESLPDWPIIISGAVAFTANMQPRSSLHVVKDFSGFMEYIA